MRANSVFKDWIEDSEKVVEKCIDHDVNVWKVQKFVKDGIEQDRVRDLLKEHYITLKALYAWYSAKSNYPSISNPEFMLFVNDFKIQGGKVTQQILENNFISAHSGMQGVEGTVDLALLRF